MYTIERAISARFKSLEVVFDEKSRRLWAAAEAESAGKGGVTAVHRVTGISRTTIYQGIKELKNPEALKSSADRTRNPGGGRKRAVDINPELQSALEALLEPITRGDPESPLRWTCKSLSVLAIELNRQGHCVSDRTVGRLLSEMGYSLQANRKTTEGKRRSFKFAEEIPVLA